MRPINCPLAAERDLRSILAVLGRPRAASLRPPRSGTSIYCRLSVGRGGRLGDARTSLDVTGGTCPARAPAGRSPLHPCCGLSASPRARTRASLPARPRPGPARGAGGAAAAHRGCRRTRRARQGPIDCAFCCVGSPRLRRRGDATEGQLSSPHGAGHAACRWRQPPAGLPARSTGSPPCSPPLARPPRTTTASLVWLRGGLRLADVVRSWRTDSMLWYNSQPKAEQEKPLAPRQTRTTRSDGRPDAANVRTLRPRRPATRPTPNTSDGRPPTRDTSHRGSTHTVSQTRGATWPANRKSDTLTT